MNHRINYPAMVVSIFIGIYAADMAATVTKYYAGRKILRDAFEEPTQEELAEQWSQQIEEITEENALLETPRHRSVKVVIGQAEADAHRVKAEAKAKQRSKARLIAALFAFAVVAAPFGGLAWYAIASSSGRQGFHDWQKGC